jgi:hypothetical protein
MPVHKKKPITVTPEGSTSEPASPRLPEQEEFRQHFRRLAVSAVQVLVEQVMLEELELCVGASWGECTPNRRGYRNGSSTRDLGLCCKKEKRCGKLGLISRMMRKHAYVYCSPFQMASF